MRKFVWYEITDIGGMKTNFGLTVNAMVQVLSTCIQVKLFVDKIKKLSTDVYKKKSVLWQYNSFTQMNLYSNEILCNYSYSGSKLFHSELSKWQN